MRIRVSNLLAVIALSSASCAKSAPVTPEAQVCGKVVAAPVDLQSGSLHAVLRQFVPAVSIGTLGTMRKVAEASISADDRFCFTVVAAGNFDVLVQDDRSPLGTRGIQSFRVDLSEGTLKGPLKLEVHVN